MRGMEQTFNDLLQQRAEEERRLFGYALWMFVETSAGIIRDNMTFNYLQNKRIIGIVLAAAFILLLPLLESSGRRPSGSTALPGVGWRTPETNI